MMALRAFFLALFAALSALSASAEERIDRFNVTIDVQKDGDLVVTERIDVTAEGAQIRRGIFRDLPRYFESEGATLTYGYDVLGVKRDGRAEPYATETEDAAYRIRIGDADVLIPRGPHAYEIRYRVRNQVRYFAGYDEVYWNATGNYWTFPILSARISVVLPAGARVSATKAYTGALGAAGADYTHTVSGGEHVFEAARRLEAGEGITIAIGFDKGLIDPPSAIDQGWLWWQRNGALAILLASLAALAWFHVRSFDRVGRDPPKGPVFALYEPPKGFSPAAAHHIYYRGLRGHTALIATLMNLAVKGRLRIDASNRKVTILERIARGDDRAGLATEDAALEQSLFRETGRKILDREYDSSLTAAYTSFKETLSRKYGSDYFRWNAGYTIAGLMLTAGGVVFAATQASMWTEWHTLAVLALAGLNILFLYLMPAPTPKGQKVRTEIEGFRLYMETAEKLQLNAVEVGSEKKAPPMSRERYEAFLPYAVALGVEKPWTRHFERLLPKDAEHYTPGWVGFYGGGGRSLSGLNDSLISSMNSGVSSALPQSSSSSGSSGGGSSGGGGGGGGGGGW